MKTNCLRSTLFGVCLLVTLISRAQINFPVSFSLSPELTRVIRDYPQHFKNLTGAELARNPQSVDYQSLVTLKGAAYCQVSRFITPANDVASWEALMYTSEDFEEAATKFRQLYGKLTSCQIRYTDFQSYSLQGFYEEPSESIGFTSVFLHMSPTSEALRDLTVELSLNFEFPAWMIRISVYGKDHPDGAWFTRSDSESND